MYAQISKFVDQKVQSSNLKRRSHTVNKNPEVIASSILSENPILADISQTVKKMNRVKKEINFSSDLPINKPTIAKKKEVVWLL